MAVIALGMAGVVAPLTTAVLSSIDERHTGTASGFYSATARTGGLIVAALADAVIAEAGTDLVDAFRAAAIVAAILAVAAGGVAFVTLGKRQ
jgi:MFS family permease